MVPTLEVFSFSATTLVVFPTSFLSPVLGRLLFSHAPYLENSGNYDPIWKRSLRVFKPKSRPGCYQVSWCRGVAPLTSERRRLARGRPQAPAGEPRRRCCTSTAPPGAPTTSMGVPAQPMGSRLWMRRRGGTDVRQSFLSSQEAVLRRRRRPQRSASAAR